MRIALLVAASLLATACDNRESDDQTVPANSQMPGALNTGQAANAPLTAEAFAQTVAMSDMYEIAAGELALEKAESDQTREFARMMVTDHTRSTQGLREAIAGSGQTPAMPDALDIEHQSQIDTLRNLDGADFDRQYMTQQRVAHERALDLLQSYANNGDVPALRQFAQTTAPVVQKHHDWILQNNPDQSTAEAAATNTNNPTS